MPFLQGKRVWIGLILALLLGNIGLAVLAKRLYWSDNALRLDPLQLALYPSTSEPKQHKRVVFFGDSRALSWPAPAMKDLEFVNRGIGQQTSAQIQLRFDQHVRPLQADVVVLQLCVNDLKTIPLFPERQAEILARCERNLGLIIDQARSMGSQVIVTTVFPLGVVPPERWLFWSDAVAESIVEVNTFIRTQAGSGVVVLDAYALLLGTDGRIRPEYSRDLLHLNAAGYERLNAGLVEVL